MRTAIFCGFVALVGCHDFPTLPDAGRCVVTDDCPQGCVGEILNVCAPATGKCHRLCDEYNPCHNGSACVVDYWATLMTYCAEGEYP